jgi:PAS domain S-box-containing protein
MSTYPESEEAAAYLAAIVDSSDDAIISKNLSGIIQTWNKGAERIFGYTAAEVIGRPILVIIPPHLYHEEESILGRLRKGQRIDHFETVRRRKDGALINISLTVSPVRDATGRIIGASKVARDITERKRAEQAIADAQGRLAVTLQSIGDAVLATDMQARVTYVNAVAEKLLGYTAQQAIGRPLGEIFRIINQDTRRVVDSPVERVIREGIVVGLANHTVLLRPDGTDLPIDDSAAPIKTMDGTMHGVVLVFRDVTERYKSARQAAILSAIVSSSDDAIVSKDLSGTITSWNQGAEKIFGYTAQEMIGRSILTIIPPERHEEEAQILAQLRVGKHIDHYETVRCKKNGERCDISLTVSPLFDDDGRVVGASKIGRDITEQKRARQQLFEAEERWRVTLESIGDAVVATDTHAGVTFVNEVAAELMGGDKGTLLGRPLNEVFVILNDETRVSVESPVDRVIREGIVVGLANHTVLVRPDGSQIPIDDSAAPIRDHEGRLLGVVLVFRDITARKEAEIRERRWNRDLEHQVRERTEELVRSQEQLRGLAAQLAMTEQRERRRLAVNLHDSLAQLLALACMKLGQLKRRVPTELIGPGSLIAQLDEHLQQGLQYTRTVMAQLSPSVLHDLGFVAAIKWLAQEMQQHDLKVEVSPLTEEQPAFIELHGDMLFQCVRELLINVRKHASVKSASVTIEKRTPDAWVVTIEDRGIGFDLASVDYRSPGEHFGLFSIQERMESMGGWCVINSAPDRGTKVELGLPTSMSRGGMQRRLSDRKTTSIVAPVGTTRTRLLLVDDHAMIRQGLRSILESYRDLEVVAEAADGEEALAQAQVHQPDVIIMDLNLPRLSGIEATRHIKETHPHIVIIGLSVQSTPDRAETLLGAGAAALLNKEQAAEDLYAVISRHMPPKT